MLNKGNVLWTRDNEIEIFNGRKCDAGDFYFQKRTLSSIDPFTNEKVWTTANEYAEPCIQILKGDEHEVIAGAGLLRRGDIIATLDWRKEELSIDEPTSVGGTQYLKGIYKENTYLIKNLHPNGLGSGMTRQIIYLARETS